MASHHVKLVWRSGMTFDAVLDGKGHLPLVFSSGFEDPTEGQQGYSPMGMLLAALAGCTAMDVVSILKKKRQNLTYFEVEVEGEQQTEHPHIYRNIGVTYRVNNEVSEEALERAIELSVTKYCSVNAMLKEVADITYHHELLVPNAQ